jgi:hypothetical protein
MPDPSIDEVSKSDWDNSLTTTEQTDIREQVEQLSSTGWTQLSDSRKDELIREAIGERDTLYNERMSRLPTLDGDAEVFTLNLAAHKWTLASGGEAQSESGEGGSVSYANGGAGEDYLKLTRYGKTALRHVWTDSSISAVRSW